MDIKRLNNEEHKSLKCIRFIYFDIEEKMIVNGNAIGNCSDDVIE